MYFKQKSNVIFRNYESFGYITDNRNFGYKQANNDGNDIGDKIVSQSGAVEMGLFQPTQFLPLRAIGEQALHIAELSPANKRINAIE